MKKVKLNEIAEISSGLSYRRYLDGDGKSFKVIVQRSIKKDGVLEDFEKMNLREPKSRYFSVVEIKIAMGKKKSGYYRLFRRRGYFSTK